MEKVRYEWLIVGAGLFGSVFAHEMTKSGKRCLVIDKRRVAGGNCACERIGDVWAHKYGAHIIHTDSREVWQYIDRLMPLRPYTHQVMARTGGRIYTLPFCMHTFRELWGCVTPKQAQEHLNNHKIECDVRTVKDLALSAVGEYVYDLFIRDYNTKQWGRTCDELEAFILGRIPVRLTWDVSYYNEPFVGLPRSGNYNDLFDALLDGCDVALCTEYTQDMAGMANRILYTAPIDEYFGYKYGRLPFRSLQFRWELETLENTQGCAVVNYCDMTEPYTRRIEHNYFNPNMGQVIVVSAETPTEYDGSNEPIYPINNEQTKAMFERYQAEAHEQDKVIFGGRLGSYAYYSMSDTIKAALSLSRKYSAGE